VKGQGRSDPGTNLLIIAIIKKSIYGILSSLQKHIPTVDAGPYFVQPFSEDHEIIGKKWSK